MTVILRSRAFLRYLLTFLVCCVASNVSLEAQIPGATVSWLYVSNSGGHHEPFLATGPDGNAWFIDETRGVVGKLAVSGTEGTETTYPIAPNLPPGQSVINFARAIAGGPDAVWFIVQTCASASCAGGQFAQLGRITSSGSMTIVPIAGESDSAAAMVVGPDGNIWFKEANNRHVVRVTPQGVMTPFTPSQGTCCGSRGIAVGPDQNIWFSEGKFIGRLTPSGTLTEFPVTFAAVLATGPDGNLWYAAGINEIGRLTPSGQETLYTVSGANGIGGIAVGSDGNIWFTSDGKDIGQLVIASGTANIQTCSSCPSSGTAGDIVPISIPTSTSSGLRAPDDFASDYFLATYQALSGPGSVATVSVTSTAAPKLKIEKTHWPNDAGSITYEVTVTNIGSASTIGAFTVEDVFPSEVQYLRPQAGNYDELNHKVSVISNVVLKPTKSTYFIFPVSVTAGVADGTIISNEATVSGGGDPQTHISDPDTFTAGKPLVKVTKSHSGDRVLGTFQWTIRVENISATPTSGPITITDTLPAGVTLQPFGGVPGAKCSVAGATVTCTTDNPLGPGQPITIPLPVATIPKSGPIENSVTASGGGIDPTSAQDLAQDRSGEPVTNPNPQSTGGRH